MTNLEELKKLTEQLTSWQPKEYHEGYVTVDTPHGISKAYKLMYEPSVAVCKTYFSAGCKYGSHKHEQKEFIMLYKGCIKIATPYLEKILNPGDCFYLNVGEPHEVETYEESWGVVVTIPASEVFPK